MVVAIPCHVTQISHVPRDFTPSLSLASPAFPAIFVDMRTVELPDRDPYKYVGCVIGPTP